MNENTQNKTIHFQYPQADWGSIWREQVILNWKCQEKKDMANFWSSKEKAKEFWKKIQAQIRFYDPILDQIHVHPGDRVLDIGGGPGTIAIPLAKKGANVTVVEPAEGMVAVLSENIQSQNISGISVIRERWEDLAKEDLEGSFDHVIACFSLGMPDIVESIRKIVSVSRGQVYLVWFSGLSSWDQMMEGLCRGACGSRYYSGPKSEMLYLVLNQMNIHPDILNIRQVFTERYDSFDSAILQMLPRCKINYPGKEDFVKEWVGKHFIEENGNFVWDATVTVSIIKWDSEVYQIPCVK